MTNASRSQGRSCRGFTTVAVLVCLIVVTIIVAALLKVGLAQRDQVRSQERKLQAEWLAESGLDRALARLAADEKYAGEEWSIPMQELASAGGRAPGQNVGELAKPAGIVTIRVNEVAQHARRRLIHVQADCPVEPPMRVRHTRQVLIDIEPEKAGVAP